jgi:hypothetical protein
MSDNRAQGMKAASGQSAANYRPAALCSPDSQCVLSRRFQYEAAMKRTKAKHPERSFPFLRVNQRGAKPRKRGLTEIRGPYYSVVGQRCLEDLFETMGAYVDSLKFAGGSFALMPERAVRDVIDGSKAGATVENVSKQTIDSEVTLSTVLPA